MKIDTLQGALMCCRNVLLETSRCTVGQQKIGENVLGLVVVLNLKKIRLDRWIVSSSISEVRWAKIITVFESVPVSGSV